MRIKVSQLRQLIKEELRKALQEEAGGKIAAVEKLVGKYNDDPERMIAHAEIKRVGLPVDTAKSYHVVYGQVVAQLDGDDIEYWSNESGMWEKIDYENRQHPVIIHASNRTSKAKG